MDSVAKIPKRILIFILIMLQTSIAIACGFTGLYLAAGGRVPSGVYVMETGIGGLTQDEAVRLLLEKADGFKEKSVKIKYGSNVEYEIRYDEIGAELDPRATVLKVCKGENSSFFSDMISGSFSSAKKVISPVIRYDEDKLAQKLKGLSLLVDREAVDASISLREDKLLKIPEVNGLKLNPEKVVARISESVGSASDTYIELKAGDDGEIDIVYPLNVIGHFDGIEEVIAQYSTDIKNSEDPEAIELAVSAINRELIFPAGGEQDSKGFSFNKQLDKVNGILEKNNEGYNQVASTLYAAVLIAGIDPESVTRNHHTEPVNYIEPGLDAVVFGTTVDFTFQNTLQQPVMIFAGIRDGKVIVTLVGKKKESSLTNSLKVDIEQKFSPPVVYTENKALAPGSSELVSPGREGLKLSVYVVSSKDGAEVERRLVEACEYKAVETILQIGPDTGWGGSSTK